MKKKKKDTGEECAFLQEGLGFYEARILTSLLRQVSEISCLSKDWYIHPPLLECFSLFLSTFSFGTGRGRGDLKNFLFGSEYQFGSEVQSDRRPSILFSAFLQQIFHWRYFGILKLFGSSCTPVKIGIPFCLCDLKVLAFQCTLKISLSNGTFFIMTIIILGHNFLKGCLVEF